MNHLITLSASMTMGTKEIADLLGKNHSDIKRSAERLFEAGAIGDGQPLAEREFKTEMGNSYSEYLLGKIDSITLVAQNCPKFTAALVKRWDELENGVKPAIPQTYAAALLEAGRLAMELEQSKEQLAIAAPKAEFVDRYVDSTGTYGFRQAAKMLDVKESEFRAFLLDNHIMYRLGGKLTAYAHHIDAGRFIQRAGVAENEHAYTESRFTAKGIAWLAGEIAIRNAKAALTDEGVSSGK